MKAHFRPRKRWGRAWSTQAWWRLLPVTAAAFAGSGTSVTWAQGASTGGSYSITSSFESGLSATRRSSTLDGSNGDDLVLQVRPSLLVSNRAGRFRGSLSYSLAATQHAGRLGGSDIENFLNASFQGVLVDDWMFVDSSASISQQSRSAYGEQSVGGVIGSTNKNRAEVWKASVSPYVTGRLGDLASYRASVSASSVNVRRSSESDSTTTGAALALSSGRARSALTWGLNGTWQEVDFRVGRTTETGRVTASLNILPDVDWLLTLRAGQESTNVGRFEKRTYDNWGGSLRWTPSPRTSASLESDRRYFGNSHRISFDHRMSRSSFRVSSVRDVSNGASTADAVAPITLYQLIFASFASTGRDTAEQERLTLEFFALNPGLDPSAVAGGSSLAARISVVQREDVAFSYKGQRATVSLLAFSSESRSIDDPSGPRTDGAVRQWGYNGTLGYRLTPEDSIHLSASHQRTLSSGLQQGNDLKSLALIWKSQVGRRTSASGSLRHSQFSSAANPYRESSISGSLSMRF